MLRAVLGIVAGLVAWIAIGTCGLLLLRVSWPAYALVEQAMTFTLGMQVCRLLVGAASSVGGGWLAVRVAGGRESAAWWLGVLLVVAFVPIHLSLWTTFPVWYHLTFLLTLAPIVGFSGRRAAVRR